MQFSMDHYFQTLQKAISAGRDINAFDEDNNGALDLYVNHYCIWESSDNSDIPTLAYVKKVLTPLSERNDGSAEHLQWFFDHGANFDPVYQDESFTPLETAIAHLDAELANALIGYGAKVDIKKPDHSATEWCLDELNLYAGKIKKVLIIAAEKEKEYGTIGQSQFPGDERYDLEMFRRSVAVFGNRGITYRGNHLNINKNQTFDILSLKPRY